jgi:hypothetical protein
MQNPVIQQGHEQIAHAAYPKTHFTKLRVCTFKQAFVSIYNVL